MKVGFEVTEPGARGKRRRVLWLQWALLAVLAYLTLLEDPMRGLGLDHLGVIALAGVTLLISFLPIKYFAASGLDFGLLLCNLSVAGIPVVLKPESASDPSFFLVAILVVAVASHHSTAVILAFLSTAALYGWALHASQQPQPAQMLVQHLPFFFLMSLSYLLLRSLLREEREKLQAESVSSIDLPEFGKALANSQDLEILYTRIPRLIKSAMKADACELLTVEEGLISRRILQSASRPELPEIEISQSIHINSFQTSQVYVAHDFARNPDFNTKSDCSAYKYSQYMAKSWKDGAHSSGVLALFSREPTPPIESQMKKFQFLVDHSVLALQYVELLEQMELQARTDGLTGVANYRHFYERLEEEFSRTRRRNYHLSILMIDVDQFKRLNDTKGHPHGDQILRDLANLLETNTRRMDLVARWGGDEFSIILPETNYAQTKRTCQRILDNVRELAGTSLPHFSVSIGSATFPQNGNTLSSLLQCADQSLYQAKSQSRARACHYSELKESLTRGRTSA